MFSLAQLNVEKFLVFTLVLTRVSGLLITSPIFGSKDAPQMFRAMLSLALAILIMPAQWNSPLPYPGSMLAYIVIIGGEMLIGLVLGLGITILIGGIQMAGDMMSRIGGLSLADVFDPTTQTNVPLFSQLLGMLSAAVFMIIGGHRIVVGGLLDTFTAIRPGGVVELILGGDAAGNATGPSFLQSLTDAFVLLVAQSFQLGIRASVPVVTAVLLATIVLGLVSRTLPQLNVMAIGFGINGLLTFSVFSFSIGASVMVFQDQIEPTLQILFRALRIPVPTI